MKRKIGTIHARSSSWSTLKTCADTSTSYASTFETCIKDVRVKQCDRSSRHGGSVSWGFSDVVRASPRWSGSPAFKASTLAWKSDEIWYSSEQFRTDSDFQRVLWWISEETKLHRVSTVLGGLGLRPKSTVDPGGFERQSASSCESDASGH